MCPTLSQCFLAYGQVHTSTPCKWSWARGHWVQWRSPLSSPSRQNPGVEKRKTPQRDGRFGVGVLGAGRRMGMEAMQVGCCCTQTTTGLRLKSGFESESFLHIQFRNKSTYFTCYNVVRITTNGLNVNAHVNHRERLLSCVAFSESGFAVMHCICIMSK